MKEIYTIVIDKDPTSNEIVKQYLEDNSKIKQVDQFIQLEDGYTFACENRPDLIFIDFSYGEDFVFDIISKISKSNENCKIVLLAKEMDAQSTIKAMKTGARYILQKPIIKNDFDIVLTKLVNEINYKSTDVNTKIVSVFSNKGGIGKTTIATNLAIEIEELTKEPVVIVDFNSQFGDVSTFLNVKTDFGISYLLNNKEQISRDFLLSVLPKYKDTDLYILSDIFYLNDVKELTLENVQDIIDALKSAFRYIIIDVTNILDLKTIKILDNSDDILFPFVANLPNLKNVSRCLEFFNKIGYDKEKVKLILNRVTQNEEIKSEYIENVLQKKIYAKITNDYFIVLAAINRGVGISNIDANSEIAKSIQSLAYNFVQNSEE